MSRGWVRGQLSYQQHRITSREEVAEGRVREGLGEWGGDKEKGRGEVGGKRYEEKGRR